MITLKKLEKIVGKDGNSLRASELCFMYANYGHDLFEAVYWAYLLGFWRGERKARKSVKHRV